MQSNRSPSNVYSLILILKKNIYPGTDKSSIVVPLGVYWKYWPGPGSTYFEWCGKFVHLLRLFREHWRVRLVERSAKNLWKKPQRFISFLQVTFYIIPAVIFWMFISLCLKNLNLLAFINQLNISSVIQWQNFSTCVITWYYITKRIYF